jgi:peroxiredoxin
MTDTIAEQVAELQTVAERKLPADVSAAFAAHQAMLNAAGVPAAAAKPGTLLPDAQLVDVHGVSTSLHAVTDGRPAVIVCYRGAWCPFCNIALKTYQEQLLPQLTERGVTLVAISPQEPDGSLSMQQKNELAFPVLSDPGNALAGHLGILSPTPHDDVQAAQARLGLDLSAANADGTDTLPMPTVVVADAGHAIGWIHVQPDYTHRTEVADILNALDSFNASGTNVARRS